MPFMKVMLTGSSSTLKNPRLLHWLVSLSYRISLGNVKDEDLKELGHDL